MPEAPTGNLVSPDGDDGQSILSLLTSPNEALSRAAAQDDANDAARETGSDAEATDTTAADTTSETGEARQTSVDTASKLTVRLAKRERALTEAQSRVKDLERRLAEAEARPPEVDLRGGDRLDATRRALAHRLGVKADDPRVAAELRELVEDALYDGIDEKALQGKDLDDVRARQAARRQRRQDAEWKSQFEERLNRERADNLRLQRDQQMQAAAVEVQQVLTRDAAKFPYLMAQDEVRPMDLVRTMTDLRQSGRVTWSTQAEGEAVLARIAANVNEHYRRLAERLLPVASPASKAGDAANNKSQSRASEKAVSKNDTEVKKGTGTKGGRGRGGSVGGAGGGGRGVAVSEAEARESDADDEPDWMEDPIAAMSRGHKRVLARGAAGRKP